MSPRKTAKGMLRWTRIVTMSELSLFLHLKVFGVEACIYCRKGLPIGCVQKARYRERGYEDSVCVNTYIPLSLRSRLWPIMPGPANSHLTPNVEAKKTLSKDLYFIPLNTHTHHCQVPFLNFQVRRLINNHQMVDALSPVHSTKNLIESSGSMTP